MAIKETVRIIRNMGIVAAYANGEWRVDLPKEYRTAETAYYTTSTEDAITTAQAMSDWLLTIQEESV